MSETVVIAVDAMGGDNAPAVVLEGTAAALAADCRLNVMLCGPAEVVEPFAAAHERCIAVSTTEVIAMGEHPAKAVRSKKDSSVVVGCRLVKEGKAHGFFSAGSTGACLAAGTLVMGRVKGVKRPALTMNMPAPGAQVVMSDIGANADCKPEYLVQFAQMASLYAERVMGVAQPTVGLLNIGEEEEKGSEFAQAAHKLLRAEIPHFKGNAEGGDVLTGEFNVVVCDGFTGNVCLKTIEGTAKTLFRMMKGAFTSSPSAKLGAVLLKSKLSDMKASVSPDTYGGSPLLGVKGALVVGHGSSNALAIENGIHATVNLVRADLVDAIAELFAAQPATDAAETVTDA